MQVVIGIGICAILFALYGLVQYRGCSGHCTGCGNSCERHVSEGEHHVG